MSTPGGTPSEATRYITLAATYGTPLYVYDARQLRQNAQLMKRSFPDALVCFAVKANSNLAVLSLFAQEGLGFDVVSAGELARVVQAGGDTSKVVFSGVGKTKEEIEYALHVGIKSFNVESEDELRLIDATAKASVNVALRVNPEVSVKTHPYIATGLKESKFGITAKDALALPKTKHAIITGVACHIGSQIFALAPFAEAIDRLVELAHTLNVKTVDIGGGFGVPYENESPLDLQAYGALVKQKLAGFEVLLEPGRILVADAGTLLMRCVRVKKSGEKTFVVVDAGMNDMIRPALYEAHHDIVAVEPREGSLTADIVGPVCESSDFFAKSRVLTPVQPGDLMLMRHAGAYGFTMSSNYNSRPRPAEVLVNGDRTQLIRAREQVDDLWRSEAKLDPSM